MIVHLTDTATGERVEIEVSGSYALAGATHDVATAGCSLTVTHLPGNLSQFAIVDGTRGIFDSELFNPNPDMPVIEPLHLASLLRRFTAERLARWRAA